MSDTFTFSICSFNINGTKDKDYCLNEKLSNFDILLLQEHLLPSVSLNFLNRSREHSVFARGARKTSGRPSGGLASIFKNDLGFYSPTLYDECDYYIAFRLCELVIINVYLPCDRNSLRSMNNFSKACESLKRLLVQIVSDGLNWMVFGDVNCDINSVSSRSTQLLDIFPNDYQILSKDESFSYIHNSGSVSDIDHCIISSGVKCSNVHVNTEERDLDHLPLSVTVTLKLSNSHSFNSPRSKKWFSRREWSKVNWHLYISTLTTLLVNIKVPYNLLCTSVISPKARSQLNVYYYKIASCLREAEAVAVPLQRIRVNTRKSLWKFDPDLKVIKNRAKLWLKIWNACGRPLSGHLFNIKQKMKFDFKSRLRKVRFCGVDFPKNPRHWKEVINVNKLVSSSPSDKIPNENWIAHYNNIFGYVNYSVFSRYSYLLDSVFPSKISQRHVIPIAISHLLNSIKKLKSKSFDFDGIGACHINPECGVLIYHLQLLFQMCLSCSMVPDSFLGGSVTSILKRGKDSKLCSSYRPITVTCTISKVFEYVLLYDIFPRVDYVSNQFGFKPYLGCQHAHRVLTSLLLEAHNHNTELHFCSLDISRAFDSVTHSQLWFSLNQLGINASIISVLRFWYSNSYIRVKFGSSLFGNIPVRSGVRQGGILSPYLFNACLFSVFSNVPSSYFMGLTNVSYIAYADDILLISRTKSSLISSTKLITSLLNEIGLAVNPQKCNYLVFNAKYQYNDLNCGFFTIGRVFSFRWLGINICSLLSAFRSSAITDVKNKLRAGYGKIVPNRGKYSRRALAKLYSSFCDHSILFLCGLYSLFRSDDLRNFRVLYFRYLKFLLYLPSRYRNTKIVKNFGATDILVSFKNLYFKFKKEIYERLGPFNPLIRMME